MKPKILMTFWKTIFIPSLNNIFLIVTLVSELWSIKFLYSHFTYQFSICYLPRKMVIFNNFTWETLKKNCMGTKVGDWDGIFFVHETRAELGPGLASKSLQILPKTSLYSWNQILENWNASGNNKAKLSIFSVHKNQVRVEPASKVLTTLAKTSSFQVRTFDILEDLVSSGPSGACF